MSQATSGIPVPELESAQNVGEKLTSKGSDIRTEHISNQPNYTESIDKTISNQPELETEPEPQVSAIETEVQVLVTPHKNLTLPNQQMPALVPTPSGRLPRLGDTPELVAIENEIQRLEKQIGGERTSSEELNKNQLQLAQLKKLAQQNIAENIQGEGKGGLIEDTGEPPRPPVSGAMQADIGAVLARLLANPTGEAEKVVQSIRIEAFPNGILNTIYGDMGNEEIPGLTSILSGELQSIAADAGVSAEDLQTKIYEEQNRLEQEQLNAQEALNQSLLSENTDLNQMCIDETGAIENTRTAADQSIDEQVAATSGENDPELIRRKAKKIKEELNQELSSQLTTYTKAYTRREEQLTKTQRTYTQAYQAAALRDKQSIQQNNTEEGNSGQSDVAAIQLWENERLRMTESSVVQFKRSANTQIETYKTNIRNAVNQAKESVDAWEAEQTGEQKSWWQRLWDTLTDWGDTAKTETEAWEEVNIGQARDALTSNLQVLEQARQQLGDNVSLETIQADESLSEEQKAVLAAYYGEGPESGDSIAAVAVGLRHRLASEHRSQMKDKFYTLIESKPAEDWRLINQLAISINGGFNANAIRSELRAAMNGGLTGWGTDEDRVYRALEGLSEIESIAVKKCYLDRHGVSLDDELESELNSNELDRAQALLNGDTITAAAAALEEAMDGWGTDEDAIMQALRGKSEEERQQLLEVYRQKYDKNLSVELGSELSSHDLDRANALVDGNTELADAIALDQAMNGGIFGSGTDEDAIEATYDQVRQEVEEEAARNGWNTAEMEAEITKRNQNIEQSFNQKYSDNYDLEEGESALRVEFKDELSDGDLDLANALADNDLVAADSARIAIETGSFWYADDDKINAVLENQYDRALEETRRDNWQGIQQELAAKADAEGWDRYRLQEETRIREAELEQDAKKLATQYMEQLESNYGENHGNLRTDLENDTSGHDKNRAFTLLEQGGYLTPVQEIEYATNGAGTEEDRIRNLLEGKTQAEIEIIREEWAASHPGETLEERIQSELSGRDEFDTDILMRGLPQNREEEIENLQDRVAWEESNAQGARILSYAVGGVVLGPGGLFLGEGVYENFGGGNEMNMLLEDLAFTEQQHHILNNTEFATPEEIALSEALFKQGADNIDTGITAYREQIDSVTDSVSSGVAMAVAVTVGVLLAPFTAGASAALSLSLAAAISAGAGVVAAMGTKAILLGDAYGDEDIYFDGAVGLAEIIAAAGTAGVGNRVLAGLKLDQLADNAPFARRLMATVISDGAEGVVSSAPSAVVGNLLNDPNWEQGNPWENILSGVGLEIGMSVAMDVGLGVGGEVLGHFKGANAPNVRPNVDAPSTTIDVDALPTTIDLDAPTTTVDVDASSTTVDMGTSNLEPASVELQNALPSNFQGQVPIHVDPDLSGNTVRVHYDLDANGLVTNVHMRIGAGATPADIQLHVDTVRTMNKYSGFSGRVRRSLDRIQNWIGINGHPPLGSRAWEAKLEIEKLPNIIGDRMRQLANPDLDPSVRANLEAEVDSLDAQLREHQAVFESGNTSDGVGYVAANNDNDLNDAIEQGLPDPRNNDLIPENLRTEYFYARNPNHDANDPLSPPYFLRKIGESNAPSLSVRRVNDNWVLQESGTVSPVQQANEIVNSWSPEAQTAFRNLSRQQTGQLVVPVRGIATTSTTFNDIVDENFTQELMVILEEAYTELGHSNPNLMAQQTRDQILAHEIVVIRGTGQLRRHGYRGRYITQNGVPQGDLHHPVPLMLGGEHTQLLDISADLHNDIHALFDEINFDDNTTLAPSSIQNSDELTFESGAAVLNTDGSIQFIQIDNDGTVNPITNTNEE